MENNQVASEAFRETFAIAMQMSDGDFGYSMAQATDAFALIAGDTAIAPESLLLEMFPNDSIFAD